MLNNFRNLSSLYQSLGARWLMFRVGYALRMRTGFIRKQIPAYQWKDRPLRTWLKRGIPSQPGAYAQWRKQNSPAFFRAERSRSDSEGAVEAQMPRGVPWNPQLAVQEAERILNGELKYFAHKFFKTGFPPDWYTDPDSEIKLDSKKHWSEISNEGDGDIKFVWEPSRFSMLYTLVRAYASTRDERFAEAFWTLIQSWAESNPPNTGPNWMDGQEAALRLMAWTFGFYAFMDSPFTTPEQIAQFTVMVAAHAERIYKNIDYAISTHSNHTISEAFGLWLAGLLFPELKEAEKYFALGRKLLEQEAATQIFPDGTYSMYSLNYHRFILHIYFYAIRLGEINNSPFSTALKDRVAKSIDHLYQLIDPATGQMPVYGSNDGALVLPLNNCDFTDYRPLLQLGAYLTKKEFLFEPGPWDEDLFWFYGAKFLSRSHAERKGNVTQEGKRDRDQGKIGFPNGGIYVLRGANSKAVIRCTDFHARPSHADQLHVDLWWRGINIACDAGTYLYSGEGVWQNGLTHTSVHNTVTVDHQDQMKMVSRFTWTNWAKGKILQHDEKMWQGEHDGYKRSDPVDKRSIIVPPASGGDLVDMRLADPVNHKRTVLSLGEDRWLVVDHLAGKQPHDYALHWLLSDFPFEQGNNLLLLAIDSIKYKVQVGLLEGKTAFSIVRADLNSTRGWRSRYYAEREPAVSVMLEARQPKATFWSFFGLESDSIELPGNVLKIRFADRETTLNLYSQIISYKTLPKFYAFSPKQSDSSTSRRRSSMANE